MMLVKEYFFPHVIKSIRATENFSKLPIKDQNKIIDELEKEYKKDFKEINEDTMPGSCKYSSRENSSII